VNWPFIILVVLFTANLAADWYLIRLLWKLNEQLQGRATHGTLTVTKKRDHGDCHCGGH
jgi:hypothetical protein